MIGHLQGTVHDRGAGLVIVSCGGVGYEVHASSHTLATIGPVGSEVSLRIFTHFTDSKITLFGFASAAERQLFDLLITVKNVGPSSAIKILSAGAGPEAIASMICSEETAALKSIKGVGKKTADLLVVELREKCEGLLLTWKADGARIVVPIQSAHSRRKSEREPILDEVVSALVQLGWKPNEADKAVANLVAEEGASIENLLVQALRGMPR